MLDAEIEGHKLDWNVKYDKARTPKIAPLLLARIEVLGAGAGCGSHDPGIAVRERGFDLPVVELDRSKRGPRIGGSTVWLRAREGLDRGDDGMDLGAVFDTSLPNSRDDSKWLLSLASGTR